MEKVNEVANPEFKWLKKRGHGKNKETQFYESFIYDGVEYTLYDCVYMYKKDSQPYIGKLVKIWEQSDKNKNKAKKVKVHWFFRPEEVLKWLGDTKTLENEIFLASGEGVGLANTNPLEAIAGQCNVVCVSKDCRNPQPSNEELKAADYIFYRTFEVQSCTILDKMDDKIGGIEIKNMFNRKEGENVTTFPESTSDGKDENQNTTTCSEPQPILTKSPSTNHKDDKKVGAEGKSQAERTVEPSSRSGLESNKVVETNSETGKTKGTIVKVDMNDTNLKDTPDKGEMDVGMVPVPKVGATERITTPMELDKLHDRPSKKNKSNGNTTPKDKQVEIAGESDGLKDMLSNDRPLKKIKSNCNTTPMDKEVEVARDSDGLKDLPSNDRSLKKIKSNGTTSKDKQVEVSREPDRLKDTPSHKSNIDSSVKLSVDNLKDLGTSGATVEKPNRKNGKVTGDFEGKILKKARTDGSFKVPANKKNDPVQKASINGSGSNGKDVEASSALPEGKDNNGLATDSFGTNKEPKREQYGESNKKLSVSKSPKASALPTDEDKKITYQEFVIGPKPHADKSSWFRLLPWEQRLKEAYDQGTAILLHNLDPDYTSREVEDTIWHALKENCEAKMLQRTAASSTYCGQALILLKSKEAAQRILTKLDEECLMLPNGRPLVATMCPPISQKKGSKFFGHLTIDKIKIQNQREMDEAVSTSHFSQPNTIDYDMAMEWCLLQSRSNKWWRKMHKQQRDERKELEAILKRK